MTYEKQHKTCFSHRKHRLTCEQFDQIRAEAGCRCEICGIPEAETPHKVLAIDHDTDIGNGAVRGLLCASCNTQLGRGLLDPDAMDRYLANPWHKRVGLNLQPVPIPDLPIVDEQEAVRLLLEAKAAHDVAEATQLLTERKKARVQMVYAVRVAAKSGMRQRDIVKTIKHTFTREAVYFALHEDGRRVA